MRKSKLYEIEFIPKTVRSFLNNKGIEDMTCWDFSVNPEQRYILWGGLENAEGMKFRLKEAETEKKPIKIIYVKKSGRRFINQVL